LLINCKFKNTHTHTNTHTQVAGEARRDHGGNDSAFSALGGLTTQSLEVTVQSPDVVIGSLRLRAKDCGWLADSHFNVCFYMSCADGNPGDALALKQRLASHAMVLAQARCDAGDAHKPRIDYLALHCKADELVFLAFALLAPSVWWTRSRQRARPSSTPRRPSAQAT
jgi:hypothetical protein